MSSNATLAMTALAAKLATVATVRQNRAALETTSATLPVITLISQSDARTAEQDYDSWMYTRRAVIEYKALASTAYQTSMDDALKAIRAVLVPDTGGAWLSGYAQDLRDTGATFYHPADNGSDCALQVNIEFDYLE